MNEIRDMALAYLERGWSVFPLEPREKRPWGAFPLKTFQRDRRATAQELSVWWRDVPESNVGIATGRISGFFVVDCDTLDAFYKLEEIGFPNTLTVRTGKGAHVYFAYPDFSVGNRVGILSNVDIRGDGGYVVAPPSVHPSGAKYEWACQWQGGIAPAPEWLIELLLTEPGREGPNLPPTPIVLETADQTHVPDLAHELGNGNGKRRGVDKVVVRDVDAYLTTAFNEEISILHSAAEGTRNHQLNESAFNLGQLVGAGVLTRHNVEGELLDTALAIGLNEKEARATIASGLNDGMAQPRQIIVNKAPAPNGNGHVKQNGKAPSKPVDKPVEKIDREGFTDMGNAKRLVKRWGDRIRYVGAFKKWFVWDGTRWQQDETGAIMRAAKDTVLHMYRVAPQIADGDKRQRWLKFAMNSESRNRLENMIHLAQTERKIVVKAEKLDANQWLLNCRNATVDLSIGKVREQAPADMITKRIEVSYDPKARCHTWLKFLNRIMNNDAELVEFLQRAVGYTLTGETTEQCLFFMYGTGRNGKSTFIETLLLLLGEYASKTPTETLMARDRAGISNDVARLAGKRLVVARETDENQYLAEATIKDLTGGDKVTARFLHQEFFDFKPAFKIWMYGNHKPLVRGTDEGIWRRIRLVPFAVTIPPEERDPRLPLKLEDELSGILNWALEGCKKWRTNGLGEPKAVHEATAEYRADMDVLAEFISECCTVAHEQFVTARDFYARYARWCEEMGERAMSQRGLGVRLKERGFRPRKATEGLRVWDGIGIKVKPLNL